MNLKNQSIKKAIKNDSFFYNNKDLDYPIFSRENAVTVKSLFMLFKYSATVLLPSFTKG